MCVDFGNVPARSILHRVERDIGTMSSIWASSNILRGPLAVMEMPSVRTEHRRHHRRDFGVCAKRAKLPNRPIFLLRLWRNAGRHSLPSRSLLFPVFRSGFGKPTVRFLWLSRAPSRPSGRCEKYAEFDPGSLGTQSLWIFFI